jgi:hypothetical protein
VDFPEKPLYNPLIKHRREKEACCFVKR